MSDINDDDINTDTMTPAWVCFDHDPAVIAKNAYAGLIVDDDVASIAAAIDAIVPDPATAARMGGNGRAAIAARYTWDRVAEEMEEHYAAVRR